MNVQKSIQIKKQSEIDNRYHSARKILELNQAATDELKKLATKNLLNGQGFVE